MPLKPLSTNEARRLITSAVMDETGLDEVPIPDLKAIRQCFVCVQGDPYKPGDRRHWDMLPDFNKKIRDFSKHITQKV